MKINIVGSILGTTGYDSHTRQLANALYELNPDIKLDVPLPVDWQRHVNDAELNMINKSPRRADVTICIATPPFWRLALADNPKHFVGFLVWEGDKIPEYWIEYLRDKRIDQILVPSIHTENAILNCIGLSQETKHTESFCDKIKIVPHGVDLNIFKPTKVERCDKFTFICNKGWRGGWEDRGGVGYVLKAFCEEFGKDEPVCLLLKLNPSYLNPQLLQQELDKLNLPKYRPEIKINIDNIPFKTLPEIYCQGDVYVCAQRADAFNLPGLEAMGCGLPTIQTHYGGQIDYMTDENSWYVLYDLKKVEGDIQYEEVRWAVPNVLDLRRIMRHVFHYKEKTKEKGKQSLKDARNWTWRHSAKKALSFINQLNF